MFRFVRWIARVITIVWIAAPAGAQMVTQAARPIAASCADNFSLPGASEHCNLRLHRGRLEQGPKGDVIARIGLLRPIKLTRFVIGDSAQLYARRYERTTGFAMQLEAIGVGLFVPSLMAGWAKCSVCAKDPNHRALMVARAAGISLFAVGIPFQFHGRNQGYKAISFHNAALAR